MLPLQPNETMKKMTFTLDDEARRALERASDRLGIPKSQVVREAVRVYGDQLGRLDEAERRAKLEAFDKVVPRIPARPREEVEAELAEAGEARRRGGRGGASG